MTSWDITQERLRNQRLSASKFKRPAEVVQWLGAVQAQDYHGAKWALGQRMRKASEDAIEDAFARGEILRTHVMRPTWHFVAPADIRWLLKLTAPRVNAASAYYYRKFELDETVFKLSNKALTRALRGGKQLTRDELRTAVQRAGVAADDLLRFAHILLHAELDGVICSGARKGNQFTYALLDERAPQTKALIRDEALAKLALRYFTSHGPATFQDFAWWSGLTTADAKTGLAMVERQLVKEDIDRKLYWFPSSTPSLKQRARTVCLLPAFDEYLVAYKDRSAVLARERQLSGNVVFKPSIVVDGQIVGSWKPSFKKSSVIIALKPSATLSTVERLAVTDAAQRYSAFLGMTMEMPD
jgi:winged helix DNA-binding protein